MPKINIYLKEKWIITEKNILKQTGWQKGILNSINTKNAFYKTLIQTSPTNEDVYSRLKTEYTEYRAKLRLVFEKQSVYITWDYLPFTRMTFKRHGS